MQPSGKNRDHPPYHIEVNANLRHPPLTPMAMHGLFSLWKIKHESLTRYRFSSSPPGRPCGWSERSTVPKRATGIASPRWNRPGHGRHEEACPPFCRPDACIPEDLPHRFRPAGPGGCPGPGQGHRFRGPAHPVRPAGRQRLPQGAGAGRKSSQGMALADPRGRPGIPGIPLPGRVRYLAQAGDQPLEPWTCVRCARHKR